MEFNVKVSPPVKTRSACLIVAVSEPRKLSTTGQLLDKASKGSLSKIIRRGDMDGRSGQSLLLHNLPGIRADRVLLIGCGKEADMNATIFIKTIGNISDALENCGSSEAHAYITDIPVEGRDVEWKVRQTVLKMNHCRYRFEQLKSNNSVKKKTLGKLIMNVPGKADLITGESAIEQAIAISDGISIARDLGNLPSNICTPSYIAKQAKALAKGQKNLTVTVLEEADMRKLKMGSLLSVSAGSHRWRATSPPRVMR